MNKTIPSQDLRIAKIEADPTCSKCGITKTPADFASYGVDYWCRECHAAEALRRYHKKRSEMSEAELKAVKDKINRKQNERRAKIVAQMSPSELVSYRKKISEVGKLSRGNVRDEVYAAYGGYKCACCGETEKLFLSIDHINNDGAEHRRTHKLKTGEQLHRWLRRNNFPSGFQVLCMNCQWGKRDGGVCPHQR